MKILRIFGVLVLCLFAASDGAVAYISKINLYTNGGNLNADYADALCAYVEGGTAKWYKHHASDSDQNCPTSSSAYTTAANFSLSGSDLPEKQACDENNENCENERFVSYNFAWQTPNMPATSDTQTVWRLHSNTYRPGTSAVTMRTHWAGINGKTKLNITYLPGEATGNSIQKTCLYGDTESDECQILPADTFVAPAGKYFDGWFCNSGTNNCYITRYLPDNFATPFDDGTSRFSDFINGEIPDTMAYAYTGKNDINLTASWAPHKVGFYFTTSSNNPYAPVDPQNKITYSDKYTTDTGGTADIIYGSKITLNKNLSRFPVYKSPYHQYDINHGNDQWCEPYPTNPITTQTRNDSGIYISDYEGISPDSTVATVLAGHDGFTVYMYQSCTTSYLYYGCGSFAEEPGVSHLIKGIAPNRYKYEYQASNGNWVTQLGYRKNLYSVNERNWPLPAKPYPDGGGECAWSNPLTHTGETYYVVNPVTSTDPGNGCCIPTEYGNSGDADTGQRKHAVFKGWKATGTRNGVTSVLTHNGWQPESGNPEPRLLQPNEYGYGSPATNGDTYCDLTVTENTFANEYEIDHWDPANDGNGCNLWPWSTNITFFAVWDYEPILVTLNGNSELPSVYLDYDVGFFTEDTFENPITNLTSQQINIPEHAVLNGYYWCPGNGGESVDDCETPEQIIDANGNFIAAKKTFTKVDAVIWPMWECEENYHKDNGACIENKINIVYNSNGHGGDAPESYECTHDEEFNLAAAMQETGFTFNGWHIENTESTLAGGASVVCNAETFGIQYGTVNLTAQWNEIEYYARFKCTYAPNDFAVYVPNYDAEVETGTFEGEYFYIRGIHLNDTITIPDNICKISDDLPACAHDSNWVAQTPGNWYYQIVTTGVTGNIGSGTDYNWSEQSDIHYLINSYSYTSHKILYKCGTANTTQWYSAPITFYDCNNVVVDDATDCHAGEGITFLGWATNQYEVGSSELMQPGVHTEWWSTPVNITLTAQWCDVGYSPNADHSECVANGYTVNYLCNNNTDTFKSDTVTFGQDYNVKTVDWSECTKDNATFVDWVFSANNEHYAGDGTAHINPWQLTTGEFNMVAQWSCNAGYHEVDGICVPIVHTITLSSQGADDHGTLEIYAQSTVGVFLNYTDGVLSNQMTEDDNPITIPQDTSTLTYDLNGGSWTSESPSQQCISNGGSWTSETSQCTADRTFKGYYKTIDMFSSDQYIENTGFIKHLGITTGATTLRDLTWLANWINPMFTLDKNIVKENLVFSGWLQGTFAYCPIGNSGTSHLDPTVVAQWQECNWTPGEHSSLNFETVTDNQCVYTVVCDTGYSQNGGSDNTTQFTFTGRRYNSDGRQNDGCFGDVPQPPACHLRSMTAYYNCGVASGTHAPESESVQYETTYTVQNMDGCDTSIYEFNGWKTDWDDSVFYTGEQQLTWDRVQNQTFTAQWCRKCEPGENATCTLDASTAGTCTYTTTCPDGYAINGDGTYNPTCTAVQYSVTYTANGGNGEDVVQNDIAYMSPWTTYGFTQTNFTRAGHILTGWQHENYSLLDHLYDSYGISGNVTLPADWGQCVCSLGTGVESCTPGSTDQNTCTGTATCLTGYTNPVVNCVGVNCTSECTECDENYEWDEDTGTCVEKLYTISFSCDNGYWDGPNPEDRHIYLNGSFTLPNGCTRKTEYENWLEPVTWGWDYEMELYHDELCGAGGHNQPGQHFSLRCPEDLQVVVDRIPHKKKLMYNCGINDNTLPDQFVTYANRENVTIASADGCNMADSNYEFKGWLVTSGGAINISNLPNGIISAGHHDDIIWSNPVSVTLTAQWECIDGYHEVDGVCVQNTITLVYDNNGHGETPESYTCTYGEEFNLAAALTEQYYVFGGWKLDTTNETLAGGAHVVCNAETFGIQYGTVNLTAQWADETYTLTFDCTDDTHGTQFQNPASGVRTYTVAYGDTITIPGDCYLRPGIEPAHCIYDENWFYNPGRTWDFLIPDGHGAVAAKQVGEDFHMIYHSDINFRPLSGCFSRSIVYSCGTVDGVPPNVTRVTCNTCDIVNLSSPDTCTPNEGTAFLGWRGRIQDEWRILQPGLQDFTWPATNLITLTAQWECIDGYHEVDGVCVQNTITLVYDNNGHGETPESYTCTYGEEFNLAAAPQETGFTFNGWHIENTESTLAGGAPVVCNAETFGVQYGTVNLNAQWNEEEYYAKFYCGGFYVPDYNAELDNGAFEGEYFYIRNIHVGDTITIPDQICKTPDSLPECAYDAHWLAQRPVIWTPQIIETGENEPYVTSLSQYNWSEYSDIYFIAGRTQSSHSILYHCGMANGADTYSPNFYYDVCDRVNVSEPTNCDDGGIMNFLGWATDPSEVDNSELIQPGVQSYWWPTPRRINLTAQWECADGYHEVDGACVPTVHTITLSSQGADDHGTLEIYAQPTVGVFLNYTDGILSNQMTENNNPITIPQDTSTLTYDLNGGSWTSEASQQKCVNNGGSWTAETSQCTAPRTFKGYHTSGHALVSDLYIKSDGLITQGGITRGVQANGPKVWHANWTDPAFNLDNHITKENMVFSGWLESGTQPFCPISNIWTSLLDQTEVAQWQECNWTPGEHSSLNFETVTDNQCVYTVVCDDGYSQNGGNDDTTQFTFTGRQYNSNGRQNDNCFGSVTQPPACQLRGFAVNYLCNNNTGAFKSDAVTFGQDYNVKTVDWSECTKDNATFVDWVFSANNEHYAGDGTAHINPWQLTTGEFNMVAQWSCNEGYREVDGVCIPSTITLVYDSNGHGETPESYTCTYGEEFNLAAALTEQHYVFGGWKLDTTNETLAGGAHVVCNAETFGLQYGTVNLTAQWADETYTLTFDCTAGAFGHMFQNPTSGVHTYTVAYGDTITVPEGCYLRPGIEPAHCVYDEFWFSNPTINWTYAYPDRPGSTSISVGREFHMIYHGDILFIPSYSYRSYIIRYLCGTAGGTPPNNTVVNYQTCDAVVLREPDGCVPGENMIFTGWLGNVWNEMRVLQPGLQDFEWAPTTSMLTAQWGCKPGYQLNGYGTGCILCGEDQHVSNNICADNVIPCTAPNAITAIRTWDTTRNAYSSCQIQECADGYHIESNACVLNVLACEMDNGYGEMHWDEYTETWGQCAPTECDPGYEHDGNDNCIECANKYATFNNQQDVAVSSYTSGCQIAACMYQGEKYALDITRNECVPICEDNTDHTGTLHWDNQTHKCDRTCNPGYLMW